MAMQCCLRRVARGSAMWAKRINDRTGYSFVRILLFCEFLFLLAFIYMMKWDCRFNGEKEMGTGWAVWLKSLFRVLSQPVLFM
jgi:hypothetical protein